MTRLISDKSHRRNVSDGPLNTVINPINHSNEEFIENGIINPGHIIDQTDITRLPRLPGDGAQADNDLQRDEKNATVQIDVNSISNPLPDPFLLNEGKINFFYLFLNFI